jgi:hypothetical protein
MPLIRKYYSRDTPVMDTYGNRKRRRFIMALAPLNRNAKERLIEEEVAKIEKIVDAEISASIEINELRHEFRIDLVPTPGNKNPEVRKAVISRYAIAGWNNVHFEQRSTCMNEDIFQLILEQN